VTTTLGPPDIVDIVITDAGRRINQVPEARESNSAVGLKSDIARNDTDTNYFHYHAGVGVAHHASSHTNTGHGSPGTGPPLLAGMSSFVKSLSFRSSNPGSRAQSPSKHVHTPQRKPYDDADYMSETFV
jgi:hypothetical protein